jgi:hypothetical protein
MGSLEPMTMTEAERLKFALMDWFVALDAGDHSQLLRIEADLLEAGMSDPQQITRCCRIFFNLARLKGAADTGMADRWWNLRIEKEAYDKHRAEERLKEAAQ